MSSKTKSTKAKASDQMTKAEISQAIKLSDQAVERKNAANHKRLALAIAKLIADDPYVEWEIVSAYCRRNNRMLVLRDEKMTASPARTCQPKQARPSRAL